MINTLLKIWLRGILLFMVSTINLVAAQSPYNSGFQQIILKDKARELSVAIWYPTLAQQPIENIGDNAIFIGENAIRDAVIADGLHPLILISHGLGGSWINQIWLASALSKKGYIVASPNHPGTSAENMNRVIAQNMLERPNDINRIITELFVNKKFSSYINHNNIVIIGHSYGGWTAIETIGGQFSSKQFSNACQAYPNSVSCIIFNRQMRGLPPDSDYFKLDKMVQDPRIKVAIILDVSFAYGFTTTSLAKINIPVLIVSASSPENNRFDEQESRYLLKHLPLNTTEYMVVNGATHFSFIGVCKTNAIKLLTKKSTDDALICQNEVNNRAKIHRQLINKISTWLNTININ